MYYVRFSYSALCSNVVHLSIPQWISIVGGGFLATVAFLFFCCVRRISIFSLLTSPLALPHVAGPEIDEKVEGGVCGHQEVVDRDQDVEPLKERDGI